MASIKILSGAKKKDVVYMSGKLPVDMLDGTRRIYLMKDAVSKITKRSEDKKRVIFDLHLHDGLELRAEAKNSIFHEFVKYEGPSLTADYVTTLTATRAKINDRVATISGCLILIGILYGCALNSGEKSNAPDPSRTLSQKKVEAVVNCQTRVRNSLKSPKSADFPWDAQPTVSADETIFTVASYVDAKNAFNAEIRTRYLCVVEYEPWANGEGKITRFSLMP